jgi:hypothetical protein
VHGFTYLPDLLPGIVIMGAGVGLVLVGVQNVANGGVPADKAGLAAVIALRSPNVRVVDMAPDADDTHS